MASDAIVKGLTAKGLDVNGMVDKTTRDSSQAHKLGDVGEARALQLIVEGYTNSQINRLLVADGILAAGDSMSKVTLARLRKLPQAQVDAAKLTDEAVLCGHMAVSEVIVGYVDIWRNLSGILSAMTPKDFETINPMRLNVYFKGLDDSSKKILEVFAPNLPDRVAEEIARLREASVENVKQRNYANDALQHVVGLVAKFLKQEIDRDTALAKINEFVVAPEEQ